MRPNQAALENLKVGDVLKLVDVDNSLFYQSFTVGDLFEVESIHVGYAFLKTPSGDSYPILQLERFDICPAGTLLKTSMNLRVIVITCSNCKHSSFLFQKCSKTGNQIQDFTNTCKEAEI